MTQNRKIIEYLLLECDTAYQLSCYVESKIKAGSSIQRGVINEHFSSED
jgi:hypothetical protein